MDKVISINRLDALAEVTKPDGTIREKRTKLIGRNMLDIANDADCYDDSKPSFSSSLKERDLLKGCRMQVYVELIENKLAMWGKRPISQKEERPTYTKTAF